MKPSLLILAVLLAFLACIPCTAGGCAEEHRELSTQAETHHDHPDDGACNPFCLDRCCANQVICESAPEVLGISFANDGFRNFPFPKKLIPQPFESIWQPPKL